MERVIPTTGSVSFEVFVDDAQTPDALSHALATTRTATKGSLVCVVGCAASLDVAASTRLAEVVTRHASIVYVTSDHPSESLAPQVARIMVDALRGRGFFDARGHTPYRDDYVVVPERRVAIARAIEFAREWHAILVAGGAPGDREVARDALDERVLAAPEISREPPRALHVVTPEPAVVPRSNLSFEVLDDAGPTRLSRLVLRHGETFEINYSDRTHAVIHCVRGACNVVSFDGGRCDVAAGQTLRGLAHTLYFQQTGDELDLLILSTA